MFKLNQSSIFKKEYEFFTKKINQIENIEFKEECNHILSRLLLEVKNLDTLHNELNVSNRLPIGTNDARNSINNLRQQLITKLKDWDEFLRQTN